MTIGLEPLQTSRAPRTTASFSTLAVAGAALALALAPGAGRGQIVLDGTTGAPGALTGPSYTIPSTLGTRVGQNLFHSFSEFNVLSGESATFTSATGTTQNIIGRVTGANPSQINGLVASTVSGASLWLINPNGLVIGAGATLNVQGSFYASTADALLLPGGGRFDAANPQGSTLTIGNPVAFGFLDAQIGAISITGATLRVPSGRTLGLVGGSIDATSATLTAPAGHVVLASAAGAVNIGVPGAIVAGGIGNASSAAPPLGAISLTATSVTTAAGTGEGGGAGGGGGGSGAPKLKVMPPSSECERNRDSPSRPRKSTVLRLSALKKRYFTEMSILSVIACRTPAITCHAKRVSLSSRIAP